jgi:tRNA(Ile)-lysidine synthase
MPPSSPWPFAGHGPRLIRPLLGLSRAETEATCQAAGVSPIEDETNRSPAYRRNRVRHEVLPLLRQLNPRVDEALIRLADSSKADLMLLNELAEESLQAIATLHGTTIRLDKAGVVALPKALQSRVVQVALERAAASTGAISDRHVRAVVGLANGPSGAELNLPRGLHVEAQGPAIVLSVPREDVSPPLPDSPVRLTLPGGTTFGRWHFESEILEGNMGSVPASDRMVAHLAADALGSELTIRHRQPGDRFQPLGLRGTKKLQDFFVDARVPRAMRDAVPLVCSERGIVWVAGLRPADWAKVTQKTARVVRLRASGP